MKVSTARKIGSFCAGALVVGLLLSGGVRAQQKRPAERLRLVHALEMTGETVDGRRIYRLVGQVVFRQGEMELRCDRATQYVDENRVVLEGNVVIRQPGKVLRADRIEYFDRLREEWAEGHVVAEDSARTLRCDRLHYQENIDYGVAEGHVELEHREKHVRLQAARVRYDRANGMAVGEGKPVIVQEDSTGRQVFRLSGERVAWYEDARRFEALGNVEIVDESGSHARCDSLVYYRSTGVAYLRGKPHTWRRWERMFGHEMEWFFAGDTLREVRVRGKAFVLTEADTLRPGFRQNRVKGDSLVIFFSRGEASQIVVRGRATSLYYLFEEGKPKGVNWILGDEIRMWVSGNKLTRVRIVGDPERAEGKYYPERLVAMAPVGDFEPEEREFLRPEGKP